MNKEKRKFSSPIYAFLPTKVEGFDSLAELALDMRWSYEASEGRPWAEARATV